MDDSIVAAAATLGGVVIGSVASYLSTESGRRRDLKSRQADDLFEYARDIENLNSNHHVSYIVVSKLLSDNIRRIGIALIGKFGYFRRECFDVAEIVELSSRIRLFEKNLDDAMEFAMKGERDRYQEWIE